MEKIKSFALSKKGKTAVIISGVITALISAVMNVILIPKIEMSTNGIRCFDMNFGYSYETAKDFLAYLSESARNIYLNMQLPLDFIYPLAYCAFFCFIIIRLTKKANALLAFPLLLFVFDYAENITTIVILKSAELTESLAKLGSAFTSVKTILMYSVFLEILICFIYWLKNRKSAQ